MFSLPFKRKKPSSSEQLCYCFSLASIKSATQNFNEKLVIGKGGFGKVYKGQIKNGGSSFVAIKQLGSKSKQGSHEFKTEIEMLSKLRHSHLVPLVGYCDEYKEMILVYEYMPQGSLEDRLCRKDGTAPLSWVQRLNICIGAACGLQYIQTGMNTKQFVIHRDIKSSNILLDEDLAAKIADFGLSKIGERNQGSSFVHTSIIKGTPGYWDPDYIMTGNLTKKSDVYAFGVVLLEVLCGRAAKDIRLPGSKVGPAKWAQCLKDGIIDQIIDPSLRGQILPNCLTEFRRIARQCLRERPEDRPSIEKVVARLMFALKLQKSTHSVEIAGSDAASSSNHESLDLDHFERLKIIDSCDAGGDNEEIDSTCGEPGIKLPKKSLRKESSMPAFAVATKKFISFECSYVLKADDIFHGNAEELDKTPYGIAYVAMYKLSLENGNQVVTKWLTNERSPSKVKQREFEIEVAVLGKIRHPNILALRAFYVGSYGNMVLIYDYMPHNSLTSFLCSRGPETAISWEARMNIAVGISRALCYLHTEEKVTLGNLCSSNILLDKQTNPMISDACFTWVMDIGPCVGKLGYLPRLRVLEDANTKDDIYCLGVIILELLIGKSASVKQDGYDFLQWVKDQDSDDLVDEELRTGAFVPSLLRTWELGASCLHSSFAKRPSAYEVLKELEEIIKNHEVYIDGKSNISPETVFNKPGGNGHHDEPDKAHLSIDPVSTGGNHDEQIGATSGQPCKKPAMNSIRKKWSISASAGKFIQFDGPFVFTVDDLLNAEAVELGRTPCRSSYVVTYRACLDNGNLVVAKRLAGVLSPFYKNQEEFETQAAGLAMIRHPNILAIRAYYFKSITDTVWIFDYMPNGNLESFLSSQEPKTAVRWPARMNIAVGITRALCYLHTQTSTSLGNLRSRNILLDKHYNPVIAYVGFSRFFNNDPCVDMLGCYPPELKMLEGACMKIDIYCLGVIILELLTGKSASVKQNGYSFLEWMKNKDYNDVVDEVLRMDASKTSLRRTLGLGLSCIQSSFAEKPSTQEVLKELEDITKFDVAHANHERSDISQNLKVINFGSDCGRHGKQLKVPLKSRKVPVFAAPSGKLIHVNGPFELKLDDFLGETEVIHEGTSVVTCKVILEDGNQVLVKKLTSNSFECKENFETCVAVLGKIHHPNILPPRTCYLKSEEEKAWVFDYMSSGNLTSFLLTCSRKTPYSWPTRLNLIVGITRGLYYLHTQVNIVHGNLKPSNILLDQHNNPLIVDVLTWVRDATSEPCTLVYQAPEIKIRKKVDTKTDIYSLGVIIAEILTGKSAKEAINLIRQARTNDIEATIAKELDVKLWNGINYIGLHRTLRLGRSCIEASPVYRPEAQLLLQQLEEITHIDGGD